jgi:hypothetical protein
MMRGDAEHEHVVHVDDLDLEAVEQRAQRQLLVDQLGHHPPPAARRQVAVEGEQPLAPLADTQVGEVDLVLGAADEVRAGVEDGAVQPQRPPARRPLQPVEDGPLGRHGLAAGALAVAAVAAAIPA